MLRCQPTSLTRARFVSVWVPRMTNKAIAPQMTSSSTPPRMSHSGFILTGAAAGAGTAAGFGRASLPSGEPQLVHLTLVALFFVPQ